MQVTYWELFFSIVVLWTMYEFFKMREENDKPNEGEKNETKLHRRS